MTTKQVSVRLVAQGGQQVKTEFAEVGREGTRALTGLDRAARSGGGGLQNLGFQVQDFAVQVGAGTSATQALGQQLPQLLSGFGLFGVAIGTASAVLIPLAGYLFSAGEATASLSDQLGAASGSVSSVEAAVSALRDVQAQYNETIAATGGVSSSAAALVVANSEKEFQARKKLLEAELQLLRLRSVEDEARAANLSAGIRLQAEAASRVVDPRQIGLGGTDRAGSTLADFVNLGPRNTAELGLGPDFLAATERDRLELQKLRAELTLTGLTVEETQKIIASTFGDITGGAGGAAGGAGGGAIGGGAARAAEALRVTRVEADKLAQAATMVQEKFGSAFADMVTGSKTAQQAVQGLLSDLARTLANRAFQSLVGGFFGGGSATGSLVAGLFGGGRATGGPVSAGTTYLVGERGPELVTMGGNGFVTPNSALRGAGGPLVSLSIDARGAQIGAAEQIAAEVSQQIRAAIPDLARAASTYTASRQNRGFAS